jgi:hypothetical protein
MRSVAATNVNGVERITFVLQVPRDARRKPWIELIQTQSRQIRDRNGGRAGQISKSTEARDATTERTKLETSTCAGCT